MGTAPGWESGGCPGPAPGPLSLILTPPRVQGQLTTVSDSVPIRNLPVGRSYGVLGKASSKLKLPLRKSRKKKNGGALSRGDLVSTEHPLQAGGSRTLPRAAPSILTALSFLPQPSIAPPQGNVPAPPPLPTPAGSLYWPALMAGCCHSGGAAGRQLSRAGSRPRLQRNEWEPGQAPGHTGPCKPQTGAGLSFNL